MDLIVVNVDREGFEYDIHSLFKAFYHEYEVKVCNRSENISSSEGAPEFTISFDRDNIFITLICGDFMSRKISIDGINDTSVIKNLMKKLIYECLHEITGKDLPWGILTGIRPTKIAMGLLKDGASEDEASEYMKDVYLLSDEKCSLAIDIAKRERALLDTIHYENGYSLYIGIPFCPTTCLYCSFTSYPIGKYKDYVMDYLDALFKELDYVAEANGDKILDSIYIGGGTPTSIEADDLERLLKKVTETFDLSNVKEFTLEAGRPDSITEEKLKVMKKYNVSRFSINPQTMNQKTLDFIGRRHRVEDIVNIFDLARKTGLLNINMDIILGLPGEGEDEVRHTIEEIKKLNPENLTVHSLAIKRASRLSEWIKENGVSALNNTDETMKIAFDGAKDMGMVPYYLYRQKNMSGNFENVGFAKEGHFGIYNILIMEEVQTIIACGAGTVTKRVFKDGRIERCDNVKDVLLYIDKIDEMIDRKRKLFGV